MCIDFFSSGLDVHRFFLLMAQKVSCASIFSFDGPKNFTCIDFFFWWPKKFHVHRFFCADDFMCIDFFVLMTSCASIFLCWWPHVHRFFVLMTSCALAWKNHVHRFYCWILIF
jgi:hypothetical protein